MSNYSDSAFTKDENSSWFKVFKLIKPGSKVLDVGCSSGTFGKVLIDEKKCVVHGIEIDESDRREAGEKLQKVFPYNIETDKLDGLDNNYDYIYFGDVIEHLVNPGPSLKRIAPYLKKDGRLLFSVPNMTHGLVRLMMLQGRFEYGETGLLDKTHLHFYDYDLLQSALNQGGFEVDVIDPVKKDIPVQVIKQELAKVGLKSTDAFVEYLRESHASYYQFVGSAKKVKEGAVSAPKPLEVSSPVDLFQTYLDNTVKYYEDTIAAQKAQNKDMAEKYKQYEKLEQDLIASKKELDDIKSSKSWKMVENLRRVKHMGRE